MTGLGVGQRGIASLPRGQKARGVVKDETVKRYSFLIDGSADAFWILKSKVKPESTRKPTAKLEPYVIDLAPRIAAPGPLRAIPKPDLPEECPAWLEFVRRQPCCNCGSRHGIEAHHEGKKDAFAQKVRDTLSVGLCVTCHSVYTQKNRLPILASVAVFGDDNLRSRQESLDILRTEQERLLGKLLQQLAQADRIELLSKGLAKVRGLAQLLGRVEAA